MVRQPCGHRALADVVMLRHTIHFPHPLRLLRFFLTGNQLFGLPLLFVSYRCAAVSTASFCDMISKTIPLLQLNIHSVKTQLRIFTQSACDPKFSNISPFSSEDLHSDLLHLLPLTSYLFLPSVISSFGLHIFGKKNLHGNDHSGLLIIV